MEKNKQKDAFLAYEADGWFERNKEYLLKYNPANDEVIKLMQAYEIDRGHVLEIGCSAGHRLNGIKNVFPNTEVYGIEPSQKAIAFGKNNYKNIHLLNATADHLAGVEDESMDVVIVGFMLYVIDRPILLKVISEINRVLKDKGTLIIVDFYAEKPQKKEYSHIKNFSAYSFKQNYYQAFTSTNLFFLIHKSTLSHTTGKLDASNDYYNNYSIVLLKKDIDAGYK